MTTELVQVTKDIPTYSSRMDSFPDVQEDLEKYQEAKQQAQSEDIQKWWNLYFKMMKALNMKRTHHVRTNSWGMPDKSRPDGTPYTKPSRALRAERSHKRAKAAKVARKATHH